MSNSSQAENSALSEEDLSRLTFRRAPYVGKFTETQEGDHHLGKRLEVFEFGEHSWLGDDILLTSADGSRYTAGDKPFQLPSGVQLTYGQINGLAGDFYATENPISDGSTFEDQVQRFLDAWNTLAAPNPRLPAETNNILAILQKEVDAVAKALKDHQDPSVAYSKLNLEQINRELNDATCGRPLDQWYIYLASINWDHFGIDAHTAYIAGHTAALRTAQAGDLETAYAMNAFADHFLEDSFSAGHIRTPRRALHGKVNKFYDLDAQFMHDEDNAIGLKVKNKRGDQWTAYGDKRLLDHDGVMNKRLCKGAIQASANEIYAVFKGGAIPSPDKYEFQNLVPILDENVIKNQELAALFIQLDDSLQRRSDITDRRTKAWTTDWWAATTYAACYYSGWWKYQININGPSS